MADILEMVKGKVVYAEDVLELFYVASAGQDKAFVEIVEDVIQDTPTADVVEMKHGYIIEHQGNEDDYYCQCSVCKTHEVSLGDKYCSECGAKMDGGAE